MLTMTSLSLHTHVLSLMKSLKATKYKINTFMNVYNNVYVSKLIVLSLYSACILCVALADGTY